MDLASAFLNIRVSRKRPWPDLSFCQLPAHFLFGLLKAMAKAVQAPGAAEAELQGKTWLSTACEEASPPVRSPHLLGTLQIVSGPVQCVHGSV